jgi:hypothetical protein
LIEQHGDHDFVDLLHGDRPWALAFVAFGGGAYSLDASKSMKCWYWLKSPSWKCPIKAEISNALLGNAPQERA